MSNVLVSADIVFSLVAGAVLWLGFSVKMMLATHCWFGCCRALLNLSQELFSGSWSASERICIRIWVAAGPGEGT